MKASDIVTAILITLFLSFQGVIFDKIKQPSYCDVVECDLEDELNKMFYIDTRGF